MLRPRHVTGPRRSTMSTLAARSWDDCLAVHEVTKAPFCLDGRLHWIAPWAGVTHPGETVAAGRSVPPAGLWAALASAVGSEEADLRVDRCIA